MRVIGFDLLRGLCAVGVAGYHLFYYTGGPQLHGVGLYGVYIFFALSGASLYVAYHDRLDVLTFLRARFFRLVPLFAVVALYVATVQGFQPLGRTLLVGSLVFGLGAPGAVSFVSGGWSLGIEFALYLMTPTLLVLIKSRYWVTTAIVIFAAQRLYVDWVISRGPLTVMWSVYTTPLSFMGYFVGGMAIGRAFLERRLHFMSADCWAVALCCALAVFALHETGGADIWLHGLMGHGASVLVLIAVAGAARIELPTLAPVATWLGDISYALYLVHMVVWWHVLTNVKQPDTMGWIGATLLASAAVATVSHRLFEAPVREWGRRLGRDLRGGGAVSAASSSR
jgi:peptidoglycan/LPS O-acetylase OafA/YrhL